MLVGQKSRWDGWRTWMWMRSISEGYGGLVRTRSDKLTDQDSIEAGIHMEDQRRFMIPI